jgi:sigma-B regulation protein RsbU (phosphoserine phosphatase)
MLDIFQLDETHWGFYLLDVSGHGVRSALLSVTLSRFLLPLEGQSSMVRRWDAELRSYEVVPPLEVVAALRKRFPYDQLENLYFTLTYGVLDVQSSKVSCVRAGNPNPLLVRAEGPMYSFPEGSGAAIGLFPEGIIPDEPIELTLAPGDRLYLYSDGIVEALDSQKKVFSGDRLAETLLRHHTLPIDVATCAAVDAASRWSNSPRFEDDVSILGVEYSLVDQPLMASCSTTEAPIARVQAGQFLSDNAFPPKSTYACPV